MVYKYQFAAYTTPSSFDLSSSHMHECKGCIGYMTSHCGDQMLYLTFDAKLSLTKVQILKIDSFTSPSKLCSSPA